jgi:hypothetical protein
LNFFSSPHMNQQFVCMVTWYAMIWNGRSTRSDILLMIWKMKILQKRHLLHYCASLNWIEVLSFLLYACIRLW